MHACDFLAQISTCVILSFYYFLGCYSDMSFIKRQYHFTLDKSFRFKITTMRYNDDVQCNEPTRSLFPPSFVTIIFIAVVTCLTPEFSFRFPRSFLVISARLPIALRRIANSFLEIHYLLYSLIELDCLMLSLH